MITINITHDLDQLTRKLTAMQREQIPFATAKALTKTAQKVQAATVKEMQSKFDRPTPFTLKSLWTKPATKRDLSAMVYLKDEPFGKNRLSMAQIIGHQFAGGARNGKSIEFWLRNAGLISAGEFIAPGDGARMDQYGNMSRGQIAQIMSQLRLGTDLGWASKSLRSKRAVKQAGAMFWSRGGRLRRGVWMRAKGSVIPLLIVVRTPNYRQRIDMQSIASRTVSEHFSSEFSAALDDALRTAR